MTKTKQFNNTYSSRRRKPEFFTKPDTEKDLTDQSQLANASIKEMAKKFGIEALESKARKMYLENPTLLDSLYGHDFTQMHTSVESLLTTKKKVNSLFEKIPALIRKEVFHDNAMEFVNAYVTNDETKLTKLNKLGIVSDTQLNQVKQYNQNIRKQKNEELARKAFIEKLEQKQGALYENFKQTGDININIPKDNTTNTEII